MPTRKSEVEFKSAKKIYGMYSVKIRKDTGVTDALDEYVLSHGISTSSYIQRAVTNQLVRDKALPPWFAIDDSTDE